MATRRDLKDTEKRLKKYYKDKHIDTDTYVKALRIIETTFIKNRQVLSMTEAIRKTTGK